MEADNNKQSNISSSSTTKPPEKKRRRQQFNQQNSSMENEDDIQLLDMSIDSSTDELISSPNQAVQLNKIQDKVTSLINEMESVKTENRMLQEKNSVMTAKMGELQARLEVTELKAKMANDQMAKLVDARVAKLAGQWTEKLMSQTEKKIQELELTFASKMAKQFHKGMTESGRKMTQLECQAAICQNKQEEFAAKLASFEEANQQNDKKQRKETVRPVPLCHDYRWDSTAHVQVDAALEKNAGKSSSWTNVRSQMAISRTSLTTVPGRLVYYEVLVRNDESAKYFYYIGWVGPDFPLKHSWVGSHPGSCAINASGELWQSNSKHAGYADGFHSGDVVGSGLLITKAGQLKLFFTKNGRLNGKSIVLDHKQRTPLFSAASFSPRNASMEANFGVDLVGKPFRFDLDTHRALLFNIN